MTPAGGALALLGHHDDGACQMAWCSLRSFRAGAALGPECRGHEDAQHPSNNAAKNGAVRVETL